MQPTFIVGYDGGPRGEEALRLARTLAAVEGAHLVVAAAYAQWPSDGVLSTAFDQTTRADASVVLDKLRSARFHRQGIELRAVPGANAAAALHDLAREREADLIVVGSPRVQIRAAVGPQSTAEQVLHHSPCPVVVARPGMPGPLDRIGVAVDGSPAGRAAVAAARRIAESHAAHVRYVDLVLIEPDGPHLRLEPGDPGLFVKAPSAASEWLDHAARTPMGEATVRVIRHGGDPVTELLRASGGLDLMIAGSRDNGPLRRLVLGSVSTELVRHAACPVLVVPRLAERVTPAAA